MKNTVNLDSEITSTARKSRDWLLDQIDNFGSKEGFPSLYSDVDIHFGSFARKTKIRELDDIDLMIGLSAQGSTYLEDYFGKIEITVADAATNLLSLTHENSTKLNSRKVINKFVSELKTISQYKSAEIKRNQEAATLELKTYDWTFDIVPCFMTSAENDGRSFYLIPDGNGHWKKTDPRIDRDNITNVNQKHNGKVLNAIRLMKYWNRRATMPTIGSYLLESIILAYYDSKLIVTEYIDLELRDLLHHISSAIYNDINDPKNIQGNLNLLTFEDKQKIASKALVDYDKAVEAINFETTSGDHKSSINKWREILGSQFPTYTG